MTTVKVGTTFRSIIGDCDAEWRVVGERGWGAYNCVVTDETPEYSGTYRAFGVEEIENAVAYSDAIKRMFDDNDTWWNDRRLGETIHYHNGFGEYVRGIVVKKAGKKTFMPMALVGNWNSRDLPRRKENGEVVYGHHAAKIRFPSHNSCWRPSTTCIFEHPEFVGDRNNDPTVMTEIDLSDPPKLTGHAAEKAKFHQLLDTVADTLSAGRDDPHKTLLAVKEMLASL